MMVHWHKEYHVTQLDFVKNLEKDEQPVHLRRENEFEYHLGNLNDMLEDDRLQKCPEKFLGEIILNGTDILALFPGPRELNSFCCALSVGNEIANQPDNFTISKIDSNYYQYIIDGSDRLINNLGKQVIGYQNGQFMKNRQNRIH